jgi:hypothetical protein
VDELDKVANMKDYAALLSLMETGIVREVAERVLVGREVADPELARYITERCLRELGTRDPREAVRLARLCRTREDVDRVVGTLLKYRERE